MKKIFLILFLIGYVCRVNAQVDPHFSQYYAYPLWLNPALTGVIDGDLRINANYKNQWATIPNAYKSSGLSVDYRPTSRIGVGLNIINQAAGTAGYNYFGAYGSFGYGIEMANKYQWLNFGVQAGIINRSIDPSKFQTDSQFNSSSGYDPNLPINENFIAASSTIFDAGAGIFYHDDEPGKKANLFFGISAAHLSRPKDPFAGEGTNYKLPIRYNLHGGVKINSNDHLAFTPHFMYVRQNKNEIKAAGIYSEIKFQNENMLLLGAMYRLNDAAVANIGYRVNNLSIGVSYDFNTSALNKATNGQGGIELSLSYVFGRGMFGPSPVCPRF